MLSAALIMEPVAGTAVYAQEDDAEISIQAENAETVSEEGREDAETVSEEATEDEQIASEEATEDVSEPDDENEQSDVDAEEAARELEETNQSETGDSGDSDTDNTDVTDSDQQTAEKEQEESSLQKFTGMPETYTLTASQMEEKAVLADSVEDLNEEDEGEEYVEGQIMTITDSRKEAEMIAEAYNAEIVSYENDLLVMELDEDTSVCDAVDAAASEETNLPAVWPNYYRTIYEEADVSLDVETGDPYLNPESSRYQWYQTTIGAAYAWAEGYTGTGVKVAVLDTGVLETHEDLSVNVKGSYNESSDSSATDGHGHGTHVAGIIAAVQGNGKGGAGVAPEAEIYSIKVMNNNGKGSDDQIIQGIKQAIALNVDVINMSLGGPRYNGAMDTVVTEAYNAGIAVFVSAGNDGVSTKNYPACYEHSICVAATDSGNGRATFSTYGSWVDLSAPGVSIYSTYKNSTSSYTALSGTSMACPVAAGEAAVILGSGMITAGGSERVDALLGIMKKNTIKVDSSGMGAGITSLTKVFGLATETAKPDAPAITFTTAADGQSVTVMMKAQGTTSLYYTTDGTNPVWKDGVIGDTTMDAEGSTAEITLDCSRAAKGTVKAIAVNASGVTSSVTSKTYTLKPWVTDITISGVAQVEQGKSIQLAAAVTPTYAANKKVTWTVKTQDGNVVDSAKLKIDAKGKLTATAQAEAGTYIVTAAAADAGAKVSEPYMIQVIETGTAIQGLSFDRDVEKVLWMTKDEANPALSLASRLTAKVKDVTTGQAVSVKADTLGERVTWISSRPAVATVDAAGKITAVAAGTTTITAKANDNSGKKAAVTITIKQAVTDIAIKTDQGQEGELFTLAAGKSKTLKAAVNVGGQKPAISKVTWSIVPAFSVVGSTGVSINPATGKITAKAGATEGIYTVTASAADGQGATALQKVQIYGGAISSIQLNKGENKVTLYTTNVSEDKPNTKTITATIKGTAGFNAGAYTVTSSSEAIVTAEETAGNDGTVSIKLTATGTKYGTAKVVIAATDGSGKKAVCTVRVSSSAAKVEIDEKNAESGNLKKVKKLSLFRSNTASSAAHEVMLYAKVEDVQGNSLTAYTVKSSNENLVKVTKIDYSTGAVALSSAGSRATGKAVITLASDDGSRKATCTVSVVNPVSKISISSKTITKSGGSSYNMALIPGKSLQLRTNVETGYGVVSDKGVIWSVKDSSGNDAQGNGVSISSSGKITAAKDETSNKDATDDIYPYYNKIYTVTATAKDGSGVSANYKIKIVRPATYVALTDTSSTDRIETSTIWAFPVTDDVDGKQQFYTLGIDTDVTGGYVSVSSSNSKVLELAVSGSTLYLTGRKPGTVTVTLQATDGSGVKAKYRIQVMSQKEYEKKYG